MSAAVATTPTVASSEAGRMAARTADSGVLRPPSKRMRTSATVPRRKAEP